MAPLKRVQPAIASIEIVVSTRGIKVADYAGQSGVLVQLDLANGKSYVWHDAVAFHGFRTVAPLKAILVVGQRHLGGDAFHGFRTVAPLKVTGLPMSPEEAAQLSTVFEPWPHRRSFPVIITGK